MSPIYQSSQSQDKKKRQYGNNVKSYQIVRRLRHCMLVGSRQTFWDKTVQTFRTVASGVLKTLPTAGRRHHRKPAWCRNQKSKFLPATALRQKFRLTVCRVVVADSRHIAHPGCTQKKGSRRDCSAAGEHVTLHGFSCSVVLCFHFVQKGPSLGFWLLYTDSHPTQAT